MCWVCEGYICVGGVGYQESKRLADALLSEGLVLQSINEERERNMLHIVDAFTRVGRLAQVRG